MQEPDVKLNLFQGTAGTYAGRDRFGRVKDQFWDGYNSTADVDWIKYGHDYAGSRIYRDIDSSIYATNTKDQGCRPVENRAVRIETCRDRDGGSAEFDELSRVERAEVGAPGILHFFEMSFQVHGRRCQRA